MNRRTGLSLLGLSALLLAGCPSPQERYAETLKPSRLALEQDATSNRAGHVGNLGSAPAAPRLRTFKVRVWAASDYRSEVLNWQRRFGQLVARIDQLIEPTYGARLEVVEFRNWDRASHGETMETLLAQLEQTDRGDDVDWVIGLITAEQAVEDSIHKNGMARPLSRHFVIRNLSDIAEYRAINRVLDEVPQSDREELINQRKQHKELVVFLHEWGHTLGALHIWEPRSLMNPSYDTHQIDFSRANARILEISLKSRAEPGGANGQGANQRSALREYFANTYEPDWERQSHHDLLAMLGLNANAATIVKAAKPENPEPPASVANTSNNTTGNNTVGNGATNAKAAPIDPAAPTQEDREQDARAHEAIRGADYPTAWQLLSQLVVRHPENAVLTRMACETGCRVHAEPLKIQQLCKAALAARPGDVTPLVFLATALLDEKQWKDARAALVQLATLVRDNGARSMAMSMAPALYQRANLPVEIQVFATWKSQWRLLAWAAQTRARYKIPDDATARGFTPDDEIDYMEMQDAIIKAIDGGDQEQSNTAIHSFNQRFGSYPAITRLLILYQKHFHHRPPNL